MSIKNYYGKDWKFFWTTSSLNSDIVNSDTFYCSYHKLKFNNE